MGITLDDDVAFADQTYTGSREAVIRVSIGGHLVVFGALSGHGPGSPIDRSLQCHPQVLASGAVFQLLLFHKALVIETAGKSNRKVRSWNCMSTRVGSFLLF